VDINILIGTLQIVAFFVFLALGVHIAVAMAVTGTVALMLMTGVDATSAYLTVTAFNRVFTLTFVIIPLFIFVGLLAAEAGISKDAYKSLSLWLNKVRGGLGVATTGACTLFGAVCGSSLVTATVFAKVSAPDMRRLGYEKNFAYGLTTASGAIGIFIPPSILIIVYSILTEESPGKLLIAGITPGVLMLIFFSIGTLVIARLRPSLVGGKGAVMRDVTWRERFASLRLLWPIVAVATTLVGGIYTGFFSVMEAAGFGVLIVFILAIITRRSLKFITPAIAETISITAMLFLIFIGAYMFGRSLTFSGVTGVILNFIIGLELTPLGLVIAVTILYLILGTFMDSWSIMATTIPVLYPAVITMGIDPVWYAMCACLAIEIGCVTPPVGVNVYGVKGVVGEDVSLEDLFRGVTPYFLLMLGVQATIIAVPILCTYLASRVML